MYEKLIKNDRKNIKNKKFIKINEFNSLYFSDNKLLKSLVCISSSKLSELQILRACYGINSLCSRNGL